MFWHSWTGVSVSKPLVRQVEHIFFIFLFNYIKRPWSYYYWKQKKATSYVLCGCLLVANKMLRPTDRLGRGITGVSLIRLLNVLNIGYSSIFFVVFLDPFCFVFVFL